MSNQFIFADISSKDNDRQWFLTHKSNLIAVEIVQQPEAPLYKKFHSLFRIEIRMSEDSQDFNVQGQERLVGCQLGHSEETTCRID